MKEEKEKLIAKVMMCWNGDFIDNNMGVLSEIFDGWKNLVFENKEIEILAKKRITICVKNECKKFNKRKICDICGCYMPAKVRSIKSHCPIKKW
jgi:hypothetical protein